MLKLAPGKLDLGLEGSQLGDLGPHQLLPRVESVAVVEKLAYLGKAEPGALPHADHANPVGGFGRVAALPLDPRRRRQKSLALVETQRRHRCGRLRLEFSDAQAGHHLT
jgi:hypothetical protein